MTTTPDSIPLDSIPLGRYGVWASADDLRGAVAVRLESLGYTTLWVGGSPSGDLADIEGMLDATTSVTVATGIVNIWADDAATVAASYHRIEAAHPSRFVLGIGAGHREADAAYEKPYSALVRYLDELDGHGVPVSRRMLAALGPRTLELAAARSAGAHPYLTTPAHTREARNILGPTALLACEQKAVVHDDPIEARAIGRSRVETPYLGLSNYVANLQRLGYSSSELSNGGSDRLIDDLVAHGSPAEVAAQVSMHLDAGADHVCVQMLAAPGDGGILPGLKRLASALF